MIALVSRKKSIFRQSFCFLLLFPIFSCGRSVVTTGAGRNAIPQMKQTLRGSKSLQSYLCNGGWTMRSVRCVYADGRIGKDLLKDMQEKNEIEVMVGMEGSQALHLYSRRVVGKDSCNYGNAVRMGWFVPKDTIVELRFDKGGKHNLYSPFKLLKAFSFLPDRMYCKGPALKGLKSSGVQFCLYEFKHVGQKEVDLMRKGLARQLLREEPLPDTKAFGTLLCQGEWRLREVYDVFANDSLGDEALYAMDGGGPPTITWHNDSLCISVVDGFSTHRYTMKGSYIYSPTLRSLRLEGIRLEGQSSFRVLSIKKDLMRLRGAAFHRADAQSGVYIFSHTNP